MQVKAKWMLIKDEDLGALASWQSIKRVDAHSLKGGWVVDINGQNDFSFRDQIIHWFWFPINSQSFLEDRNICIKINERFHVIAPPPHTLSSVYMTLIYLSGTYQLIRIQVVSILADFKRSFVILFLSPLPVETNHKAINQLTCLW